MELLKKSVEKHTDMILEAERYIWKNPETGYKEVKTSAYLEEKFESLGYDIVRAGDIPGFYTIIDTKRPGPHILILAELDSVICSEHPECDKETGAVHACGHNAQCAALLGIAAALKEDGVLDKFCGKIQLCAVPAEELLEIEFRSELREKGIIKYMGGKSEFLHRGYFDGADIAFMVHSSSVFAIRKGSVGCLAKHVFYKGLAAHAGGAPWNGRNALYAATCGLGAVNSIRETFKEEDIIRVHPIITHGGEMVNAIPETVEIESYVRGKTFDAIIDANKKVNRALCGAALSLGANIEIVDLPGYAPLVNDENMMFLARDAAELALADRKMLFSYDIGSGSTDMGDLSCIMPVVHPYAGGAEGRGHGNSYYIKDPIAACVDSAKLQLGMLLLLLENGGERAKRIIEEHQPLFANAKEYLAYIDSLNDCGDRITYNEDCMAKIRYE